MDAQFRESLSGFLDFLASERRASEHTVSAYRRDLLQLEAFLLESRDTAAVGDIDVYVLRQWLGALARVVAPPSAAARE